MKSNSRKKLVYLNIIMTLLTQVVSVLLGFGIRKVFIDTLGVTYLGYNSVFANILQMLNLADLGVGVAITSFLYKPIAEKDTERINALMYIYKRVYQVLGVIVLGVGILISFFIPFIITDAHTNYSYLRILFFINLAGTVSTYYLAYKRTLLIAAQKSYFTTSVDMIVYLVTSIMQVILLYKYPNYIVYLSISIAKNIISNIILAIKCTKEYKYINDRVNKKIIDEYKQPIGQYVKDVFISRLGAYIFYSTDNIIISMFKGSLLTGYLSNYTLVTAQVSNVVTQILASIQATFGNYISMEKSLKNQEKMAKNYLCANYLIGNFCMICVMFLIQPFIGLFFGEKYILTFSTAILLSINLMLTILIQLPSQLFMIYKLYKYDKVIVIVSAILNIVISVTLVQTMGIDGVLIGTFITSVLYLYSRLAIVSTKIYKTNFLEYFVKILGYFLISIISVVFTRICTQWIEGNSITTFIVRMIIVVISAITVPALLLSFTTEFKYLIEKFIPVKIRNIFYKIDRSKQLSLFSIIFIVFILIQSIVMNCSFKNLENSYNERESILIKRINNIKTESSSGYINISFDDTIQIFKDLNENSEVYDSIFENDILNYLKELHELYGTTYTFYCMYEDNDGFTLEEVTSKYSNEFHLNSDWIKFGFHSLNGNKNYADTDGAMASKDYKLVINELIRITGSESSIEKIIRLHNYAGNFESIMSLNEDENGIIGLLTADDDRDSYYLDSTKSSELRLNGREVIDDLLFIPTDIRLESIDNFEKIDNEFLNGVDSEIIVFTHEWLLEDKEIRKKLEYICESAVRNGYEFDFPRF